MGQMLCIGGEGGIA